MLQWTSKSEGFVFGVPLRVVRQDFGQARTSEHEVIVLKGRDFFADYAALAPPERVVEVGIFEAGSILVLAAIWPNTKFLGVDLRAENPAVRRLIDRIGLSDRIELHYRCGQDNRERISELLRGFNPDLVIDDASHRYHFSKATFNISFPHLIPGGSYILEDWGWAHWKSWQKFKQYENDVSLSNLVWEVTMAAATSPEIIQGVRVTHRMMVATKSPTCPSLSEAFSLDQIYTARGSNLTTLI